ncbi:uncharacterized protein MONBRDRAFT_38628 [Monosiga brevicollis MX1]|uniref:Ribosomal protein L10 n=1 Tax=Monosiga brevicollis TaxID=81824 RepID=A9V9G8_MONBE|nr:uncharacterized protein MONBRDRAFT_38628 [Monosiga brevicollis MX1]EDQ85793.1 predicted protein [Monosiga brevicollis MX1]|eukprot:XP_001749272.1 hypothetical protein [Monosiga brevicollis MX1]
MAATTTRAAVTVSMALSMAARRMTPMSAVAHARLAGLRRNYVNPDLNRDGRPVSLRKQFDGHRTREVLANNTFKGLIRHAGLSAEEWIDLRVQVKKSGANMTILPNGVMRRQLALLGASEETVAIFKGPIALVHSDELSFKLLKELNDHPKLEMVAALVDDQLVDHGKIEQYASLPDKDTLLAQLVATLQQPAGALAQVLSRNQTALVQALQQLHKMHEDGEGADK